MYLDWAASTPICRPAIDELMRASIEDYANPSAKHKPARILKDKIQRSKELILESFSCDNYKLIFTSSATEANNIAIKGLNLNSGSKILYCKADHPSLTAPVEFRSRKENIVIEDILLNKDGSIVEDDFIEKAKTANLIVLIHVNNQSGNIHPVEKFAEIIKKINPHVHIHVDAVQSFCRVTLLLNGNIDSLSISSHKICGPKGIGALIYKKSVGFIPLFQGGGQEYGIRSSTIATPLVLSFAAAVEWSRVNNNFENARELNCYLRDKLSKLSSDYSQVDFPFPSEITSPYILTFTIYPLPGEVIIRYLESRSVYLASSSACSSSSTDNPSLEALRINTNKRGSIIRLSFGHNFELSKADKFLAIFSEVVEAINCIVKNNKKPIKDNLYV